MKNHEQINRSIIDYCVNELGYKKDSYTKYSYDSSKFSFVFGDFVESIGFPKNALLVGITNKGTDVAKAISFIRSNKQIVCILNYADNNIVLSNEDDDAFLKSIKEVVNVITMTIKSETELIQSSLDAIIEALAEQKKNVIPVMNIRIVDDSSPAISYTMIPV